MIEDAGELKGLVLNATEFSGWGNLHALPEHLRFVREHHRHLEKVALVGNRGWQRIAPKLADHFVHAQVEYFPIEEIDQARYWVRHSEG